MWYDEKSQALYQKPKVPILYAMWQRRRRLTKYQTHKINQQILHPVQRKQRPRPPSLKYTSRPSINFLFMRKRTTTTGWPFLEKTSLIDTPIRFTWKLAVAAAAAHVPRVRKKRTRSIIFPHTHKHAFSELTQDNDTYRVQQCCARCAIATLIPYIHGASAPQLP